MNTRKLIVIVGPTASGKTKLAVNLARAWNGEIVSADSRQVYQGMDIGTGKDLREYGHHSTLTRPSATLSRGERGIISIISPRGRGQGEGIAYHLIDIVSPRTNFTLAQYQKRAYRAIEDILRRGRVPILVGGTGLYVQAVVDGYVIPHAPPDFKLRARLWELSLPKLRARLRKLDLATYRTIDKNNRRRLERAIEICIATGVPLSKQREKQAPPYEVFMLGLSPSRATLDRRIDARLKERLKQGMIEEVARLHKEGVSWKRLESFGLEYRYVSRYLRAKIVIRANRYDRNDLRKIQKSEYGEMVCTLSSAIKDFSRRQMTWFKRDKRIVWLKNKKDVARLVREFIL